MSIGSFPATVFLFQKVQLVKTKKSSGVDLGCDCFAYVGNADPETWKLPIHFPGDNEKTINHIKNALHRFASVRIPDEHRAEVWRTIAGAAKAHGIKVPQTQPAPALPGNARPETVEPLDAVDAETKAARAMAALKAERLVEQIGIWWER